MEAGGTREPELARIRFEQYKLYLDKAEEWNNWRIQKNRTYLSVLSALMVVLGAEVSVHDTILSLKAVAVPVVAVIGMAVSWLWVVHLNLFSRLLDGKFDVIREMEERRDVPLQPTLRESELLGEVTERGLPLSVRPFRPTALDRGGPGTPSQSQAFYLTLLRCEKALPVFFWAAFLAMLVYGLTLGKG